MVLDEAAVLGGRVNGLDGVSNLLVHGQHVLLYQAADAAVLPEDLLSVGALLVLGGHGVPKDWKWGGSRAQDGQWGKGWAGGGQDGQQGKHGSYRTRTISCCRP